MTGTKFLNHNFAHMAHMAIDIELMGIEDKADLFRDVFGYKVILS